MTFTKGHPHGRRFKKGNAPWNKGRTNVYSDETRKQVSESLKGFKHSTNTRLLLSQIRKGERHWNWRGGITPQNKAIRRSREYMEWRNAIYKRDDYTCTKCGARGVELNADHILPFSAFPDLRFDIDNGRTLCRPCHEETPTFGGRFTGGDTEKFWEELLKS